MAKVSSVTASLSAGVETEGRGGRFDPVAAVPSSPVPAVAGISGSDADATDSNASFGADVREGSANVATDVSKVAPGSAASVVTGADETSNLNEVVPGGNTVGEVAPGDAWRSSDVSANEEEEIAPGSADGSSEVISTEVEAPESAAPIVVGAVKEDS